MGPTASGKTRLAIDIAEQIGGEIVSVDSMMVYRHMDIGTAKPTYLERREIPHHMIDVVDPSEEFSVAEFRGMGRAILDELERPVVIAGGSGLHFRALVDPMSFAPTDTELRAHLESTGLDELAEELVSADPDAGRHVDLGNHRRVVRAVEILRLTGETPTRRSSSAEADELRRYVAEIDFTAIGVDSGDQTDTRVEHRLSQMRSGGLIDEVAALRGRLGRTARSAVGYREILLLLEGAASEDEAFELIGVNTKKIAKKQRTWFQRDPRIHWIPWLDEADARAERVMEIVD